MTVGLLHVALQGESSDQHFHARDFTPLVARGENSSGGAFPEPLERHPRWLWC